MYSIGGKEVAKPGASGFSPSMSHPGGCRQLDFPPCEEPTTVLVQDEAPPVLYSLDHPSAYLCYATKL